MTVINMMVQPKARTGYIISDGAFTAPDGTLLRAESKVVHSVYTRCPWAFGVSGNMQPRAIAQEIGEANPLTIKQLVKRLPDALRRAIVRNEREFGVPRDTAYAVLIGCYWDFSAKRPQGFRVQAQRGGLVNQEVEAFEWYDMDWSLASHLEIEALLGRAADVTNPNSFDPASDGLALVHAQRISGLIDMMPGIEPGHCRIGGHVDLTEVTKSGVKVWHLHTYPDEPGRLIAAAQIDVR